MTDPILTGYLANLASDLTLGVLGALTRKAQQALELPPRKQALARCYQVGSAVLLPEDDPLQPIALPVLQGFFAQDDVRKELAALARGREIDQELLVELFEAETETQPLPEFDFDSRLANFVEAFLQAVDQEEALTEVIKIDQLRQINAGLLDLVTDTAAIRQALARLRPGSGDVEVQGPVYAENIVTGVQHIVNNYYAAGGQWGPADYQAALDRYLEWLCAASGRVVLRGIKLSGQQAVELSLQEVYVPLAAEALPEAREQLKRKLGRSPAIAAGQVEEALGGTEPPRQITMEELLGQGSRLVLIGGPGCGKTTVLQHIAWTLAEALRTDQPALAAERLGLTGPLPLPVLVPLSLYAEHRRKFADHPDPRQRQLATFISHYLIERQAGLKLPDDFFATLLNLGRHVILLLDGLDEVPNEAERALVSQAVRDLTFGRDRARFVITSRTRAYEGRAVLGSEFRLVRVLPLEPERVAHLIRQAYRAIYPAAVEQTERERQANSLIESVEKLEAERAARWGDTETNRLVTTPLLVRMLLIVHFVQRRLPDQRAELYLEVVDTLLTSAHHPDEAVAQRLEQLGGDWRSRRDMLQFLAFQLHNGGPEAGRDIEERALAALLESYLTERRHKPHDVAEPLVADFLAVSRQRESLLEERAGRYRFSHLSFQEFLAARYLAEVERDVSRIVDFIAAEGRAADSWWREPILLTVGYLNVTTPDTAVGLIHALGGLDQVEPAPSTALALSAAELAAVAFLEWGGADLTRRRLAQRLAEMLTDPSLAEATPPLRAAAGRALARLDDPRPGVGLISPSAEDAAGMASPDLVWCEVSAGPFLLGANEGEEAWDDEKPQHEVELPTFYMARYPVTNAQFAAFVDGRGYDDSKWWTVAGWAWRNGEEPEPDLSYIEDDDTRKNFRDWLASRTVERRRAPLYWHNEAWNLPNQPVVGVTWYEAMAYCAWLEVQVRSQTTSLSVWRAGQVESLQIGDGDWTVRLPTEAEWEKAAGWDPAASRKRVYAWGDTWDTNRANVDEKIGRTSAVGVFPAGSAACGALDLTGNVWEWILNQYAAYPFETDDRCDPEGDAWRVLRGGSWLGDQGFARVSTRFYTHPDDFFFNVGFRVIVAPALK